jgi:hypothetical protein
LKLSRLNKNAHRTVGGQSPSKASWHCPGRRENVQKANAILPRRRSIATEILPLAFSCKRLGITDIADQSCLCPYNW